MLGKVDRFLDRSFTWSIVHLIASSSRSVDHFLDWSFTWSIVHLIDFWLPALNDNAWSFTWSLPLLDQLIAFLIDCSLDRLITWSISDCLHSTTMLDRSLDCFLFSISWLLSWSIVHLIDRSVLIACTQRQWKVAQCEQSVDCALIHGALYRALSWSYFMGFRQRLRPGEGDPNAGWMTNAWTANRANATFLRYLRGAPTT